MKTRRACRRNPRRSFSRTSSKDRFTCPRSRRLLFEPLEDRRLLSLAPLLVDLQPGSDSGIFDDDNLTNIATPLIDITAAQAGDTINVYREGALLGEAAQIDGTLYQYGFAPGELVEGGNSITARSFDGVEESGDSPPLVVTLDATPPQVVSSAPVPESTLDYTPSAVVVSFDEPLDPSTISRSTFGLIGSGGDGTFDDGNENVIIPNSVAMTGPAEVTLDLTGVLVPNDVYQVTLAGSIPGEPIMDLAGNMLDGEFDGAFPSGDSVEGGNFVATFQVADPDGVVIEAESNDTLAEATALTLTEDPADSGYLVGRGFGWIDPATYGDYWSDPDYWSFQALAGDIVSISVDTPDSGLDPYIELRNAADGVLRGDDNSGPGNDAYIGHYAISTSGNYFVRVGKYRYSSTPGSYQLRVDVARSVQLESDANFANDSISGANPLVLEQDAPGQIVGTVAGTVMSAEGANTDEDYFYLGTLDASAVVVLNVSLPSLSALNPRVQVVDGSGAVVADTDGDATDGGFLATLAAADDYYAILDANDGAGPRGQYLLDIDIADAVSPTVISVSGLPAEGTTSDNIFSSIEVMFSEQMDPDTVVDPAAFGLREAGDDGTFGTADDRVIGLFLTTSYNQHSRNVEFFLEEGLLASGNYRFIAGNVLTDRGGNLIDGDANGTGGDAYIYSFTLHLPEEFVLEGPDNNSRSGATALPLVEDPVTSGYYLGFGLGSIDPTSDDDWWSFQAQAGDRVALALDTPNSDLRTQLSIYGESGGYLTYDYSAGPGSDAYISHYAIPSDGTYYARVDYSGGSVGTYQLRVELARGIDLESDASYANDSISGADPVTLTGVGTSQVATVAGTVMLPEGSNADEDRYALGSLNAGNVLELDVRLPSSSTLVPQVRVVDGDGNPLAGTRWRTRMVMIGTATFWRRLPQTVRTTRRCGRRTGSIMGTAI